MQGRAYAALGRVADAATSFEAAAEEAHRFQLYLFEAFALRDLKLCVLDTAGHGEHGSRRLGSVLRRLVGPAEALTPLLKGLDAAELMALKEPETGYSAYSRVGADVGSKALVAALRQELLGLRPMALQKRASADGVDEDLLVDAVDSDDPKSRIIELILQCHVSASSVEAEQIQLRQIQLRQELQSLKPTALQKRVLTEGFTEAQLEMAVDSDDSKAALVELIVSGVAHMKQSDTIEPEPESSEQELHELQPTVKQEHNLGVDSELEPSAAPETDQDSEQVIAHQMEQPNSNHELGHDEEDSGVRELRVELDGLRVMQLHNRALEEGVDVDRVEDAMESDTPKLAMIEMILERHIARPETTTKDRLVELRGSLSSMRLLALQKRATEEGVALELVEDAFESESPKLAMVELIVASVSQR
jgi:aryl carrier-like protein